MLSWSTHVCARACVYVRVCVCVRAPVFVCVCAAPLPPPQTLVLNFIMPYSRAMPLATPCPSGAPQPLPRRGPQHPRAHAGAHAKAAGAGAHSREGAGARAPTASRPLCVAQRNALHCAMPRTWVLRHNAFILTHLPQHSWMPDALHARHATQFLPPTVHRLAHRSWTLASTPSTQCHRLHARTHARMPATPHTDAQPKQTLDPG